MRRNRLLDRLSEAPCQSYAAPYTLAGLNIIQPRHVLIIRQSVLKYDVSYFPGEDAEKRRRVLVIVREYERLDAVNVCKFILLRLIPTESPR